MAVSSIDLGPADITMCPCGYVPACKYPECPEGNPKTTRWPAGSLDEPRPLPYPKFALPRHSKEEAHGTDPNRRPDLSHPTTRG